MNCPDVNTAAVTINWVTDVIVPLASALIGGLLALLGVHITLKRDKIERQLEKEEAHDHSLQSSKMVTNASTLIHLVFLAFFLMTQMISYKAVLI